MALWLKMFLANQIEGPLISKKSGLKELIFSIFSIILNIQKQ